ncbi:hypothetical protein [Bdellovibrio sp. HCB209]|uniref:hypothetical protein n=1 Tax=Bdellovibrio sp. HCB209 TaxID=3394354 RepID=UPI0039B42DFF
MEKPLLYAVIVFLSFLSIQVFAQPHAADEVEPSLTCTNKVVNTIYIPKLREVVDWPDDQIRPYALQMCKLEKQRGELQLSIRNQSTKLRENNWRVCKEVIPGNPNPTPAQCKAAHAQLINDLIDQCRAVVNIGHNPHNVGLFIDPLLVEVACLKGVDTALK